MAQLTRDDIKHLASLAKLSIEDDEIEKYRIDLSRILEYVEQLQKVDIAGLLPTSQVTGLVDVERDDKIKSYGYEQADLLKNVAEVEDNQIKVRRVL